MLFGNSYRGTFFGKSSASVLYELSVQLNKETRDMLWWRVVGVTDRVMHNKTDDEEKNIETENCNKEVYRLVPDNSNNFQEQFNEMGEPELGDEDDLFKKV